MGFFMFDSSRSEEWGGKKEKREWVGEEKRRDERERAERRDGEVKVVKKCEKEGER